MSKRTVLFFSVFILVISLSFATSFAQGNASEKQIAPGGPQQGGNQPDENRQGPPPGQGNEQGRPGGPKHSMMPEVHYIGFAVENEKNFEMAHIFLFDDKQKKGGGQEVKKIDGTVLLGKEMYLVVEAKKETEQMKIEPRPGDDESRVPKILKIKTAEAKIAKDDKGGRDNQIELGQIQSQSKKPQEEIKTIGNFKLESVEKEVGKDRKVSVISGTITIDGKNYSLYLEPRLMPPPQQQRGPGGPEEGGAGQNGNGGQPQRPGNNN